MTYRDERDALRGRIHGLEQDLDEARRSQNADAEKRARVQQIEGRMREAERDLKGLRDELVALRGPAPPQQRSNALPLIVAGFAVVGVAFGGVLAYFLTSAPRPVVTVATAPVEPPAVVTAPVPSPEPPPPEKIVPPPAPARQVAARWEGKVIRANGMALGPGAPCVVDATLESTGEKARVEALTVTCGGRAVYRSTDQLEGMSMNGSGLGEEPGKAEGTFTYAVRYSDTGSRAGPRTQASLDSTQGMGAAWSDVVPMFRVEFKLPALSAPVRGERLMAPPPAKDPFEKRF